jgi:nitrogen fixation protein
VREEDVVAGRSDIEKPVVAVHATNSVGGGVFCEERK